MRLSIIWKKTLTVFFFYACASFLLNNNTFKTVENTAIQITLFNSEIYINIRDSTAKFLL